MNDAPTVTEAPPLDGKAIADLAEQLNQLLRLRTFPIGMKLFEDLDVMADVPGLRRDVDTPADLSSAAGLGLGPRTAAIAQQLLVRSARPGR